MFLKFASSWRLQVLEVVYIAGSWGSAVLGFFLTFSSQECQMNYFGKRPFFFSRFSKFVPPHVWLYIFSTVFAWEAGEKGVDVHFQADPTRLELLQKSFEVKKDDFKKSQQNSVLEKYGGLEHLDAPPKELLLAQTVRNSCYIKKLNFHFI